MKRNLLIILLAACILLSGCVSASYKGAHYTRIGDQSMSGFSVKYEDPNGVTITVKFDSQESEGKLQIEGLINAINALILQLGGANG